MSFLRIKEWSSYQSYKDRRPPWIRFHKTLLDNYEFQSMSVHARALLPMLWLLASEDEDPVSGLLRDSYEKIAFRLRQPKKEVEQAITECIESGFLELVSETNQQVTESLRNSLESVTPETETETEINIKGREKISFESLTIDHISDWLAEKRTTGRYLTVDEHALLEKFKDYCRANNKKYKDYTAAFRNAFDWNNVPTKGKKNETTRRMPTTAERLKAAGDEAVREILSGYSSQSLAIAGPDNPKL